MPPRNHVSWELVRPLPGRRPRRVGSALAALVVAALAADGPGTAPASAPAASATGVPALEHVIVVVMENKNEDQAMNPKSCPYTTQLAASGSWFSDSHAITHPSQPNYLALWAGTTLEVGDNSCPPHGAPFGVENLGHALEAAGKT